MLATHNNSDNGNTEGFCYRWDRKDNYGSPDLGHLPGIASQASINDCFKPLLGLFNQRKFIPLAWCPLTLDLE